MTETPNRERKRNSTPPRGDGAWRHWIVPGIFGLLFLGFAALRPPCACGPGACAVPAPTPGARTVGSGGGTRHLHTDTPRTTVADTPARTAVLYLHGTSRCETCLDIERIAEETVREAFAKALAAGTVYWQSIDYDLPENAEYARVFKPSCPSLVLAAVLADGQFGRHVTLGQTWDLIHEGPAAVEAYVREELQRFMDGGRRSADVRPTTDE
jgi:hypothetical protein